MAKYLCTAPSTIMHDWEDDEPSDEPRSMKDCPDHTWPKESEGKDERARQLEASLKELEEEEGPSLASILADYGERLVRSGE